MHAIVLLYVCFLAIVIKMLKKSILFKRQTHSLNIIKIEISIINLFNRVIIYACLLCRDVLSKDSGSTTAGDSAAGPEGRSQGDT